MKCARAAEVEGEAGDPVNPVHVVLIVLAVAASITLCLAIVVVWVQSGPLRRRVDPEVAKFMEMFDEEDELLENRMEMGQASGVAIHSVERGREFRHDD